ncbi:adenosylmethionine decarboxylase [Victivallis sp. Marseille-Q1083]|uniref:adenosylmethionine decarboxylase n=1 Tax=Victivallis sp. Marseille-Q1083 TaxID=2717288 RepID=UPI0026DCE9B4|nr:adenosylmethionine decarboxylase [Victivallis sp. Marseille-Q1083]
MGDAVSLRGPQEYALGKHMTIEYYDCDSAILADAQRMKELFIHAAKVSGATVLDSNFHSFEPQGVSGFVIIAESHFSVHAWPEFDYAAVDIFTCGENISFQKAVDSLRDDMKSLGMVISSVMNRGIVSNNGIERLVPTMEDRTYLYALSWRTRFESASAWGLQTTIDLYQCDPELIRDEAIVKEFVREMCAQIGLKPYGECAVVNFSDTVKGEGFSMMQMLETSLISGHFANHTNTAYLDVFSCKFFEPRQAAEFAISFFKGKYYRMQVGLRQ